MGEGGRGGVTEGRGGAGAAGGGQWGHKVKLSLELNLSIFIKKLQHMIVEHQWILFLK